MTSETIERVRKAVNALDYIQHDWQQKDGRDTFNEQCEIIRAAFPAAPVKPGDVAEAVEALSRMIETAEKTLSLKEAEAKKGNDWVVATAVHSSQHIIKLKPLITASKQRPEVVTDKDFVEMVARARYEKTCTERRWKCMSSKEKHQHEQPVWWWLAIIKDLGLRIIKSGEG